MKNLSLLIAERLYKKGAIEEADIELYQYGFSMLLFNCFEIVLLAIIGACFGMLFETAVFIAEFGILRKYMGGYHAGTKLGCVMSTCLALVIILVCCRFWVDYIGYAAIYFTYAAAFILIWTFSPVEHPAKPLSDGQKKSYRLISVVLGFAAFIVTLLLKYRDYELYMEIYLVELMVVFLMLTEVIIQRFKKLD